MCNTSWPGAIVWSLVTLFCYVTLNPYNATCSLLVISRVRDAKDGDEYPLSNFFQKCNGMGIHYLNFHHWRFLSWVECKTTARNSVWIFVAKHRISWSLNDLLCTMLEIMQTSIYSNSRQQLDLNGWFWESVWEMYVTFMIWSMVDGVVWSCTRGCILSSIV